MHEVISLELLNFLNFGDEKKQLVGLWQVSGRRQKRAYDHTAYVHRHLKEALEYLFGTVHW